MEKDNKSTKFGAYTPISDKGSINSTIQCIGKGLSTALFNV